MPQPPFAGDPAFAERYRLDGELGHGGMATVYRAWDLRHGRPVAIKVLRAELSASLGRDRFLREITIAAQLHHPHILPLFDSGEAAGELYYVMPYLEGESLRDRLRREPRLPVGEARRIGREVADALSYAHAKGLVHRDIKPENILLESGHAVVADFGIARAVQTAGGGTLTGTGVVLGTPAYMSPEQAAGEERLDGRSDVYSLGCVLYEMLSGAPPFVGTTAHAVIAAHLTDAPRPVQDVRPEVPASVSRALAGALAKDPAARIQTAETLRELLDTERSGSRPLLGRRLAIAIAGAAVLAATGLFAVSRRASPRLNPNLVAVAPFTALDPRLALWREGLVDLLSRNLDGAGPLQTVAPTLVVRRWQGQDDKTSATALARATGARLVVFGNLLATGTDSARLSAVVFDASTQSEVAEIDLRDALSRVDRLADSLTLSVLRALGQTRGLEAFRSTSSSFHSLAALKAFLQGEQWFRRTAWDSALAAFQRAAALDSTSPLTIDRLSTVLGWARSSQDSLSQALALRAGALNHGLPPRDSLSVAFDSVFASLSAAFPLVAWADVQHLHLLALAMTSRYPDDPEGWYKLGDATYHYGSLFGAKPRDALAAFDRSIALDSSFAPSYIHPIALAYERDGPGAARRYADAYLALAPKDNFTPAIRLVSRLLDPSAPQSERVDRVVPSITSESYAIAWLSMQTGSDSAAWDLALARAAVARGLSPVAEGDLAASLLTHGQLQEGIRHLAAFGSAPNQFIIDAALLHHGPAPAVDTLLTGWFAKPGTALFTLAGLSIWALRRDTVDLQRALALAERSVDRPERRWRDLARYGVPAARAYLMLVRGDTADAIRRLAALPDSLCPICTYERLMLASLYSARRDDRDAAALLDHELSTGIGDPAQVLWALLRARTEERLGRRSEALRDYGYVTNLWQHADPELQSYVAEARAGLARLSGEPAGR